MSVSLYDVIIVVNEKYLMLCFLWSGCHLHCMY